MTARSDYPHLVPLESDPSDLDRACEVTFALDEIDRLRAVRSFADRIARRVRREPPG